VLKGLEPGDKVATSGSFLIDAETRLNPAAGSIYIGGSGGGERRGPVRPSTPDDEDVKVAAALNKLSPEDRALAEAQKFCPVPGTPLGSMGTPVKRTVLGQTVFVCCDACDDAVQEKPQETLKKVEGLKKGRND